MLINYKMSLHLFKFKEAIPGRYLSALPSYFRVSNSTTYDILVIRLLTSTIDIEIKKDSSRIRLNHNFFEFPKVLVTRKSTKQIRETLDPFKFEQYSKYSKKFYGRNINFYNNLLNELTFYFFYTNNKQNQSAFVNLYRILEFVSYSFPLIHASNYGNFAGSFNALKEYFVDDKTSEIKFFEKFIGNLFRGKPYLGYSTVFDFSSSDSIVSTNCYDIFYSLMKPADWLLADPLTFTLSIENSKLIALFKNTRNRYFHFAIGGWQRNIHSSDLKDPDFFFRCINDCFLNWLACIYKEIIVESVDNSTT